MICHSKDQAVGPTVLITVVIKFLLDCRFKGLFTPSDPVTVKFNIMWVVTGCLMGKMGAEPILAIRRLVTIGAIIKLDCDGVGDGDGVGMCKKTLKIYTFSVKLVSVNSHIIKSSGMYSVTLVWWLPYLAQLCDSMPWYFNSGVYPN